MGNDRKRKGQRLRSRQGFAEKFTVRIADTTPEEAGRALDLLLDILIDVAARDGTISAIDPAGIRAA
jgi:hypothetical protein